MLQIPTIHDDDEEEFTASSEEEMDLNIEDVRYEQALVQHYRGLGEAVEV